MKRKDLEMSKIKKALDNMRRYGVSMKEFYIITEEGDDNTYLAPREPQPFAKVENGVLSGQLINGVVLDKNGEITSL